MPTEELEHELRNVFAKATAGLEHPEQARQRLLRHKYRPASSHWRLTAGITAVAAAGSTVLGLGLSGALSSTSAQVTGTIRTAAFTLTLNTNGTATLTIKQQVLLKPRLLQDDLAKYGVRAKVTTGSFCSSNPAPAGFSRVVSFWPPTSRDRHQRAVRNPAITINPAAMPKGTELSFGNFKFAAGQETAFMLINKTHYTCSSTPRLRGEVVVTWYVASPSS